MKVIFITATVATCYMILMKFKATYDANHDSFRVEFLVVPVAGLSVLVNHDLSVMEVSGINSYINFLIRFLLPPVSQPFLALENSLACKSVSTSST